jgi:hypothetical protein
MAIAGINFFTDSFFVLIPLILTSLRPAPNAFKNSLTELLSKPSVLLMAWFLMPLSLLVTFSLNAFSIDNPQQSNKEAYLDLSKPYQQNNPQPTSKKDNQATTILKEVAGADIKLREGLNGSQAVSQFFCTNPTNTHLTTTRTKCIFLLMLFLLIILSNLTKKNLTKKPT